MTSFGNRVFAVVIKPQINMITCWIGVGSESTETVLITEIKGTQRYRGGPCEGTAEIGGVLSQTKNVRRLQELGEARKSSPLETLEECGWANTSNLDFWPLQV